MGRRRFYSSLAAFVLTLSVLLGLFSVLDFAPFGGSALTWEDANIQYLDFFAYFKDVLEGKNDISYSFGKTLGGTNIGVFSYYLSSPFSLLIAFFDQSQFHTFFNLVIALKLSLAAATCCIFLNKRFAVRPDDGYRNGMSILLSVSYAFSHYCVTQNSNIMWMDGVYMLPLILLAVYELVQGKRSWKLSVVVGLAILFNWYSAGLDCLFSIVYLLFEVLLADHRLENETFSQRCKRSAVTVARYAAAMMAGVMLSAILFLPTIAAMGNSNRGSLEFAGLLDFSFLGELPNLINGFVLGYISDRGKPSLFCGSMVLLGVMGFFTSKDASKREKLIIGFILGILVFSLYFNPLVLVFSLLKTCESYWYRYAYGIILFMIWTAAKFFYCSNVRCEAYALIKNAFWFAMALQFLNYIRFETTVRTVYITGMICFAIACALGLYLAWNGKRGKKLLWMGFALLVVFELTFSTKMQFQHYSKNNVSAYQTYVTEQKAQIQEIRERDPGLYRISQTSARGMETNGIAANYNEGLGFNYWSIAGYTSSPDDIQREMLDRFGYPMAGQNMCIVNTSILPVDSLLGVKYVLSKTEFKGLQRSETLGIYNGKCVYENPYVLPMAFLYRDHGAEAHEYENPFVYQNEVYSQLLGENVELYKPIPYEVRPSGDGERIQIHEYILEIPEGNYAIYGNLPWSIEMDAVLHVNDAYTFRYSRWLSPSVFYIPVESDSAHVTLDATASRIMLADEQFYALDLDLLADVSARISERSAMENAVIENGHARFEVDAAEGEYLYISIPYDRGWTIMRNGSAIEPDLVAGCMYSVPLGAGHNIVEMTYHVKYQSVGLLVSCLGVAVVLLIGLCEKKHIRVKE